VSFAMSLPGPLGIGVYSTSEPTPSKGKIVRKY